MTPRERIIAATNHRPTDILPIDFGAMRSTGISIVAYDKLKRYLGFTEGIPKIYDVYQQLAEPEPAVAARMGGDVVQVHRLCPSFGLPIKEWKTVTIPQGVTCRVPAGYSPEPAEGGGWILRDAAGVPFARMPATGLYFDTLTAPLAEAETIADVDAAAFPTVTDEELDFLEEEARTLYETTDKALLFAFGGNILEAGESWFGFEKFFEFLLTEPELVHHFLEKLTAMYMTDLEKILGRIGKYIQVIQFGDDLGTQEAPLISLKTYREMIKPYQQRQYQYVRQQYPEVKVFLHSCGAIFPLIPDLIDAGVEILNPVQISAAGMEPRALKESFGKDIVFWGGGANMQGTVLNGSVEDIRREVRELIGIFSEGSGFVFNQVHNIQANVPPEKILAIYDTALAFREEQRQGRR